MLSGSSCASCEQGVSVTHTSHPSLAYHNEDVQVAKRKTGVHMLKATCILCDGSTLASSATHDLSMENESRVLHV